jgi:hypothetical protein
MAFSAAPEIQPQRLFGAQRWRFVEGDKYINITFKNDESDSEYTNLGTQ